MKNNFVSIIGIGLIIFVFLSKITPTIDNDIPDLGLNKPTQEISEAVGDISKIVTNTDDRLKLCIFNKVFADRLIKYDTDQQKLNDVYVLAGSYFFGDTLKNKYEDLDIFLVNVLIDTVGDDNHVLTEEEKLELQEKFYGIAWYLNN